MCSCGCNENVKKNIICPIWMNILLFATQICSENIVRVYLSTTRKWIKYVCDGLPNESTQHTNKKNNKKKRANKRQGKREDHAKSNFILGTTNSTNGIHFGRCWLTFNKCNNEYNAVDNHIVDRTRTHIISFSRPKSSSPRLESPPSQPQTKESIVRSVHCQFAWFWCVIRLSVCVRLTFNCSE